MHIVARKAAVFLIPGFAQHPTHGVGMAAEVSLGEIAVRDGAVDADVGERPTVRAAPLHLGRPASQASGRPRRSDRSGRRSFLKSRRSCQLQPELFQG